MELKWIAMTALAAALIPAAAAAQSKTTTDSSVSRSTTKTDTVTSTSTGDVSSSSQTSNVTPEMLKGQQDPNIIGSPAWWKSHATADGKPVSAPPK
jgi:hypothetical protein